MFGFHSKQCEYLEFAFKRFSKNGQLTQAAFEKIGATVGLNMATDIVLSAYKSVKVQETYPVERFVAMALLLGYGTYAEKVSLVFSHVDEELIGVARKEQFESLLEAIIYIALDVIPLVAIGVGENFVEEDKLTTYLSKLKSVAKQAQERITSKIFGEKTELTKIEFIKEMRGKEAESILDSHQLRLFLIHLVKEVPNKAMKAGRLAIIKALKADSSGKTTS